MKTVGKDEIAMLELDLHDVWTAKTAKTACTTIESVKTANYCFEFTFELDF